jgi:hypothetical protein
MNSCTRCGSYAINPASHGRTKGADLDLCDVCYWRKREEELRAVMLRGAIADMEKNEAVI